MNADSLKEILTQVPGSCIVYTYADHGQMSEQCNSIQVGCVLGELPYYGEDITWYELDELSEEDMKKTNAVLIG